jgi:hypothetical protein
MQTAQSQSTPQPVLAQKTWKPTVAGVLDIVVSAGTLFLALMFLIGAVVLANGSSLGAFTPEEVAGMSIGAAALGVFAVILAFLGVLELLAGIYALKRKNWGLALAGSIIAALPFDVLGILALIFVAMGGGEFE